MTITKNASLAEDCNCIKMTIEDNVKINSITREWRRKQKGEMRKQERNKHLE